MRSTRYILRWTLDTPPIAAGPPRLSRRKLVKWTLAIAVLAAAIFFGVDYWRHSRLFVSTDNTYVNANTVEVAAQVSGVVAALRSFVLMLPLVLLLRRRGSAPPAPVAAAME